jgi:hypothetical protein
MRRVGHVASTGRREISTKPELENFKVTDNFGDTGVGGKMILKWIVKVGCGQYSNGSE